MIATHISSENGSQDRQEITKEQYEKLKKLHIFKTEFNYIKPYTEWCHILWNSRIYRIVESIGITKDKDQFYIHTIPFHVNEEAWTKKFDSAGFKREDIDEWTIEGYPMITYTKEEIQYMGFIKNGTEYIKRIPFILL